jgi:hypothetical protein
VDQAPVDPAPGNPAPVDQAPVDPAPGNPAPVDPAPGNPAPQKPAPANPARGGFSVRTVDSNGIQVGEILTAEPGATRMLVPGLENGAAYRFQVAPGGGSDSQFSELSEPVIPGASGNQPQALEDAPVAAGTETDQPPAPISGAAPFGNSFGTATAFVLAALAGYLSTGPGTAVLAVTTGGLLAACGLLAYKLYRFRANTRKASSKQGADSTSAQ